MKNCILLFPSAFARFSVITPDYARECSALASNNRLVCSHNHVGGVRDATCYVGDCLHRMLVKFQCVCHSLLPVGDITIVERVPCRLHPFVPEDYDGKDLITTPVAIANGTDLCYPVYQEPSVPQSLYSNSTVAIGCPRLPDKDNGEWLCESGEDQTFCRLKCSDGYWAAGKKFYCECDSTGRDCSWTGRDRVERIQCEKKECDALAGSEPSDWTCSGNDESDICWSSCNWQTGSVSQLIDLK